MAYGSNPGLVGEDFIAIDAASAAAAHNLERTGPWRKLDDEHRFQVVERALTTAAGGRIDGYPLAL